MMHIIALFGVTINLGMEREESSSFTKGWIGRSRSWSMGFNGTRVNLEQSVELGSQDVHFKWSGL